LGLGLPTHPWGLVDWRQIESEARHVAAELGEAISVWDEASRLSVGRRQMLNVAAAVLHRAAVVILDEPTSSLSAKETDWLLERIARLKAAGTGIIYVSHRQDEIFALANRITVLRDGRRVWTGSSRAIDAAGLIEQMVGRQYQPAAGRAQRPSTSSQRDVQLSVRGLASRDGSVRGVDLEVAAGEIVGLYGLVGAGRSEAAQTIFGLRMPQRGTIEVAGRPHGVARPADAVEAGIAYLPEDRLREGVCRGLSVRANLVLASLPRWSRGIWTRKAAECDATRGEVQSLGIRLRDIEQPIGQLSGGNQQKVVLGRWLLTEPKVLLLDEPTRGVDVAAKQEIHAILRQQAQRGAAVVLISSELPELFEHADRIVVFRAGRSVNEFDPRVATPAEVAVCALPEAAADEHAASAATTLSRGISNELGLLAAIGLLALAMAWTNPQFLAADNLLGILTNVSVIAILALGVAGVIIAGAIDISLGALLALAAAAGGLVLKLPYSPAATIPAGIAMGVAVGLAGGLLNATLSLSGRIHPIVVTLGTATVYRGLLVTLTGGDTIADLPAEFGRLATARWLGLNGSVVVLLLVAVAVYVLWQQTRAGRHLFALGSSPTAARLVGISAKRSWLLAFGCAGVLAGLAGMLELARNGSMQSGMGTGYELRAIAAAVIGGTAITGGRGSVIGVLSGALLLGMVSNALVLWQVNPYRYDVVLGGLLLAAVVLDRVWRWRGGA